CAFAAVRIFNFLGGGIIVAKAGVDGDHRLGVNFAAEIEELVDADIVRINSGPRRILACRGAITRTDAVAPVVAADGVSAGPAVDRATELLEKRERVCPESAHVVGRHEEDSANDARCLGNFDTQATMICRLFSLELEYAFDVFVRVCRKQW